jgi:hypothetical protein
MTNPTPRHILAMEQYLETLSLGHELENRAEIVQNYVEQILTESDPESLLDLARAHLKHCIEFMSDDDLVSDIQACCPELLG